MESLTKIFSKQEYKLGPGATPSIFRMPLEEFYRHEPSKLRKCRVKGGK